MIRKTNFFVIWIYSLSLFGFLATEQTYCERNINQECLFYFAIIMFQANLTVFDEPFNLFMNKKNVYTFFDFCCQTKWINLCPTIEHWRNFLWKYRCECGFELILKYFFAKPSKTSSLSNIAIQHILCTRIEPEEKIAKSNPRKRNIVHDGICFSKVTHQYFRDAAVRICNPTLWNILSECIKNVFICSTAKY